MGFVITLMLRVAAGMGVKRATVDPANSIQYDFDTDDAFTPATNDSHVSSVIKKLARQIIHNQQFVEERFRYTFIITLFLIIS